ncbi:Tat pathway signal sequence, partial [Klebsiella pneumoniae]
MLTRRHFLTTTGALLMTTLLPGETLAASLAEKVSETWQKINTRRNQQEAITPGWVLQSLGLKPG